MVCNFVDVSLGSERSRLIARISAGGRQRSNSRRLSFKYISRCLRHRPPAPNMRILGLGYAKRIVKNIGERVQLRPLTCYGYDGVLGWRFLLPRCKC